MLVDAFLYNGERDLLELRLAVLNDVVDLHLAVQGEVTFTGQKRLVEDLVYPKLSSAIVRNFPDASPRNAWKREAYQRNKILEYLGPGLAPDDIIMVSDVDELPDPEVLESTFFITSQSFEVCVLEMEWYQFNFNKRVKDMWHGTRICRLDTLRRLYPQKIRNFHTCLLPHAGWHFSWLGQGQEKMEAYSHVELNQYGGSIPERVQKRWNLKYETIAGIEHLPAIVQQQPEKWRKYIVEP